MTDSTVKKKVLVADDDPTILRVVSMILEKEGLEVITAEDGDEAFEKISTEGPDAILLDIEMPRMGGIELCSRLKATEVTAQIPVGFLTAHKEPDTYKQAEELGSVVFIPKPFQSEKLVMFVGLLLSSKRKGKKH
jgi:CheY-like chemotaxis protein